MREKPIGRMTLRRNAPGDGQKPKIRFWTLPDPPENSTAAKLLKHYERVFTNVDALDAKKTELKSSAELDRNRPAASGPRLRIWRRHAGRSAGPARDFQGVTGSGDQAQQVAATAIRPQRPRRGTPQAGNPGHHARAR